MKQIHLILCFLITIAFSSCKKHGDSYQITGHVYYGCPPKGSSKTIFLFEPSHGFHGYTLITKTKSDSNGYFKLESDYKNVSLGYSSGDIIIDGFSGSNIDNLEIYSGGTTQLKIFLNVSNTFSANDTLFIAAADSLGNQLKFPGPFNSGLIYTVPVYHLTNRIIKNFPNIHSTVGITYQINRNNNSKRATIDLNLCDTSKVTFEIN